MPQRNVQRPVGAPGKLAADPPPTPSPFSEYYKPAIPCLCGVITTCSRSCERDLPEQTISAVFFTRGTKNRTTKRTNKQTKEKNVPPCFKGPSPHSLPGGPSPVPPLKCGSLLTVEEVSPRLFLLSGRRLVQWPERESTRIGDFSDASSI